MNLRTRFFLVLNGLGLLILAAFASALYILGSRQISDDQLATQTDTVEKVANVCREAAIESNYITAINYFKLLRKDPSIVHAGCLDASGVVRALTNPLMIGETLPPGDAGTKYDLSRGVDRIFPVGDAAKMRVQHSLGKTYFELTRPVEAPGGSAGTAVAQYDGDFLRADARRRLLGLIRGIASASLVILLTVVLGGAALMAKTLSAPISALEAASVEFGKGNFDFKPAVADRADEVGRLAKSLTAMAQRLGELDRLKRRFLEHITHDLRSPLTAIQGYAEMMAEGISGPVTPKQVGQLKVVQANSQRLAEYIDDILDLAKLEAGGMTPEKKPVVLEEIFRSVEELLKVSAMEYGVRLEIRCEPGLPQVPADPKLLQRAVTNLVGNALKFTPKNGSIMISAGPGEPGFARVSVRDTGPGIPKENLERVFDKFFQVTETKLQARKVGTGLGLTITREIVQAHGGRIWVESDFGQGANFIFTLPVG